MKNFKDVQTLINLLYKEIKQKEWFVTGYINPIYFDNNFKFEDPDVKVNGIKAYAAGVNKIFKQDGKTRAEIINITDATNSLQDVYKDQLSSLSTTISNDIRVVINCILYYHLGYIKRLVSKLVIEAVTDCSHYIKYII